MQAPVRRWFEETFPAPTRAQDLGWAAISQGRSTLLLAPTGSGKTLAAFLSALDRLMFSPEPAPGERCRILYVSPLKALGVDVEKNLRAPIAGIRAVAERDGVAHRVPLIGIRSGDTPAKERVKLAKAPPDILITTPESLYLLLTSRARDGLASIDTVIVDEIHAMVATKRGTHLFLSLERLEALRTDRSRALQRIGLSATQRPLEEIARLLGGGEVGPHADGPWRPRPVEIVDAGEKKRLEITVEVPVEDMSRLSDKDEPPPTAAPEGSPPTSIWPAIHPRLLELIRAHRTTLIFANSRRLAERLAAALNELAGHEIACAHHGSIAKEQRLQIEERLKRGELPALVATSSLELGIDMGAIDLVIQIEAPPSIAAGLQRIGRASHQVGATSRGVIFPKYRGDLLAAAAAVARMDEGKVEETYYPRNPLDVLAQQIVAMVASEPPLPVDAVLARVRGAAPFADLPRSAFERVLDLLSGRYPSDELSNLRPRITWDRNAGTLEARQGARRLAVTSGGTIPDRGLYGVFLAEGDGKTSRRVGELDEEMVFESRVGEVFLLGASSWRIEEITHDRVLVSPAPGEPGKMPFWRGDRPGRPPELGRAIGELSRRLLALPRDEALALLRAHHLDERAASNLVEYLHQQAAATGEVPSDRGLVIERFIDEVGDWRVCLLSPFGARVHAPWAMAVTRRLERELPGEIDLLWSDDGIAFRIPAADEPPDPDWFLPRAGEVEALVTEKLADTALFAARFRENAARALLLPRRFAGQRTPLWAQRKRAADLLAVAAKHADFPIVLETYRECLRDVFDLPGLVEILRDIEARRITVAEVVSKGPSPYAGSLLFTWVANFLYDSDAPPSERRAQALSIDQTQLRELLGEAELRALFDAEVITGLERRLQRLERRVSHADALHDLLLALGDLGEEEIAERSEGEWRAWLDRLMSSQRIFALTVAGERRWAAAEDAGRYREALGLRPPASLPAAFLEPSADALGFLIGRYARTHGPFAAERAAQRFGIDRERVIHTLERLTAQGRLIEGQFLPPALALERGAREWCEADVLRTIKRQSLARLVRQVEPVERAALARFLPEWQGVTRPRTGLDALLSVIEQLQGAPIPASVLETEVLAARLKKYQPADLDELCTAGEVMWRGLEPLGDNDGRIALYLSDHYARLAPPRGHAEGALPDRLRELLLARGALFFSDLVQATGAFPADVLAALWSMIFSGEVSNDTLAPLRARLHTERKTRDRRPLPGRAFRSRRIGPPGSEGRWSLLPDPARSGPSETERRAAIALQLLARHGVLTREAVHAEGGAYGAIYPVLKALEEAGKVRRGYFVAGLGATQFALPGAEERLRAKREGDAADAVLILAATDPANAYGAALSWPDSGAIRPQRIAGAQVILQSGSLLGYLGRTTRTLLSFLPGEEPARAGAAQVLSAALGRWVDGGARRALLIAKIDAEDPARSPLLAPLRDAGFSVSSRGLLKRRSADPST